mmetsp:Transcript_30316/g.55399  ORF Transcript_30316/g.55399 Transcript_30316/m.55399 type:complete len:219 (+) Transcript_30316:1786-2442(+)
MWEQAILMRDVRNNHFVVELVTCRAVPNGDGEPHLDRVDRRGGHEHTSRRQAADRRSESRRRRGDRRRINSLLRHVGKPVEEVFSWNAHIREPDTAVVDAVQTLLGAVVGDPHTWHQFASVVAETYDKHVNTTRDIIHGELREGDGHLGVLGAAADPILGRNIVGGVDDELAGCSVIRGRRFNAHHIRTASNFGHGKATGKVEVVNPLDVFLVVDARA